MWINLRQSNAIMGSLEFNDGKMMALQGNGLDDDWTTVLGMCADEIGGSCLKPIYRQHYKITGHLSNKNEEMKGSCLKPAYRQHDKITGRLSNINEEI